ncbi:hypothetical protein HpCHN43_07750 [Helicobacter pylori]
MLFSTFGAKPNFIFIDNKTALFCNGYAIVENDSIELEILQKVLNSCIVQYYIQHTSYQIDGGYFCYQKASPKEIDTFLIDKYEMIL